MVTQDQVEFVELAQHPHYQLTAAAWCAKVCVMVAIINGCQACCFSYPVCFQNSICQDEWSVCPPDNKCSSDFCNQLLLLL